MLVLFLGHPKDRGFQRGRLIPGTGVPLDHSQRCLLSSAADCSISSAIDCSSARMLAFPSNKAWNYVALSRDSLKSRIKTSASFGCYLTSLSITLDLMEIDYSILGVFIAASIALYISPGPDFIIVASRAVGQGSRAGILTASGVSSGVLVHMFAASFGLAALLQVWPIAFSIVKWAGVAYLVYLGVRILIAKTSSFDLTATQTHRSDRQLFIQGLFCNLLNPKIAIFFLAFLPQFTDPSRGDITLQMLFYGVVFASGGLVWIIFVATLFGAVGNWFAGKPAVLKLQKWITGSTMLGLAAFVAFDDVGQKS